MFANDRFKLLLKMQTCFEVPVFSLYSIMVGRLGGQYPDYRLSLKPFTIFLKQQTNPAL